MRVLIIIILVFFLYSCKKEDNTDHKKYDLKTTLELSNYNISEKKLRDTVKEYAGENKIFFIKGKYDIKNSKKFGWWKIIDKRQVGRSLDIEIIWIDGKEFHNQIIFYGNNKEKDTRRSKFYKTRIKGNSIEYIFYMPNSNSLTKRNLFAYVISDGSKVIFKEMDSCTQIRNQYYYKLDFSKYKNKKILIKGLFTERAFNKMDSTVSINEIFTENVIE
ncbi:hypothetical protein EGI11_04740 [Chryseobacterium sp. H3056]|uniref:Lipoprotein n=1 Tax=Kaistella daneshvariae TaxID=2487074 RepID=A0A3N0WY89_9FLAO|nr:hypothetical protein [Kaistella daneshvariae]ROI10060.1 hypothetical protein EGI11_04740 [Kaistella daneshvariae]